MKTKKERIIKPHSDKVDPTKPGIKADDPTRKIPKPGLKPPTSRPAPKPPSTPKPGPKPSAQPSATKPPAPKPETKPPVEPKTRVIHFAPDPSEGQTAQEPSDEFMNKLIVGWLVVIAGPGKGKILTIGYGHNGIGRSADERISLNFGDQGISRKRHTILTYDSRGRKFYLQQGDGVNLAYVNDEPLIGTRELTGGETVEMGKTLLKFVALCGPDFDWLDQLQNKPTAPK